MSYVFFAQTHWAVNGFVEVRDICFTNLGNAHAASLVCEFDHSTIVYILYGK